MTKTEPRQPTISGHDPFFHFVPGGKFNACIGKQGAEENYIDGYMEAALELASAVIDKKQWGKSDTLAMPILYNARHALELTLKFTVAKLIQLERPIEQVVVNHNIKAHWRALSCGVGDEEIRGVVGKLEPFVASLSAIDEDGQELRYATNRDGDRSLGTYSLVDLELVQESLKDLAALLSALKYRAEDLWEEKESGTWTAECSRSDLMEIAKLLPLRVDWDSTVFSEARHAAMKRFDLSSRKFSNAVKKIEASREGRSIIGLETPLAHLTDEHALLAIELWSYRHPSRSSADEGVASSVKEIRQRIVESRGRSNEVNEGLQRLLDELAPDEVADLEAIFYIGREGWLPEFYEETLERTKREHAVEPGLKLKLNHIMEKLNFAEEVKKGLRRLGRATLSQKIDALLVSTTTSQRE